MHYLHAWMNNTFKKWACKSAGTKKSKTQMLSEAYLKIRLK